MKRKLLLSISHLLVGTVFALTAYILGHNKGIVIGYKEGDSAALEYMTDYILATTEVNKQSIYYGKYFLNTRGNADAEALLCFFSDYDALLYFQSIVPTEKSEVASNNINDIIKNGGGAMVPKDRPLSIVELKGPLARVMTYEGVGKHLGEEGGLWCLRRDLRMQM